MTFVEHVRIGGVDARWYRPAEPSGDTMLWLHGGGFVMGSIRMPESDAVARGLASRGLSVLTLDYTLTPIPGLRTRGRAPHPAPVRQAVAAGLEARHRTPGRLTLGGASAGACLAAAAIVGLRHDVPVDGGAFVYGYFHRELAPVPADIQMKRRGHRRIVHDPRVLRVVNRLYSPVLAEPGAFVGGSDLTGFPPSLLVDADHDVFRSSSERFARELSSFGVPVEHRSMPGSDHGFLNRPRSRYFERTLDALAPFARGAIVPASSA